MAWQSAPMIVCMHCEKEFQLEEYYEYRSGDTIECPNCEGKMLIEAFDTTIEFDLVKQ